MVNALKAAVTRHSGLIGATLVTAFVAAKIYAVSGFNATSAMAILSVQGTGNVVVGVLVLAWPVVAMVGVQLILAWRLAEGTRANVDWLFLVAFLVGGVFLMPWPAMALLSVSVVPLIALLVLVRRSGSAAHMQRVVAVAKASEKWAIPSVVGLVSLLVLVMALDATPWLPPEVFRTKLPNAERFVAYDLGMNDGDAVLLRDDGRSVERIKESSIRSRAFCAKHGKSGARGWAPIRDLYDGVSVYALFVLDRRPNYPSCE